MTTFATPDLEEFTIVENDIPCVTFNGAKAMCPNVASWDLLVRCDECEEFKTRHVCDRCFHYYWLPEKVWCKYHLMTSKLHVVTSFPRSK